MANEYKTAKPKFFRAVLKPLTHRDVMKVTKGLSLTERMGSEQAECPDCGSNHWMLHPIEGAAVRIGGKPYVECLCCGYTTHM